MKDSSICVIYPSGLSSARHKAEVLAERLQLNLVEKNDRQHKYHLVYTDNRLELQHNPFLQQSGRISTFVDFLHDEQVARRIRTATVKDPLAKAVGIKSGYRPAVVDATAGLGLDGMTLAWLGCHVVLIERSKIIHALLEDGIARACRNRTLQDIVHRNLTLIQDNASNIIPLLCPAPQVIYLDPMYPVSRKRALNKKEMRILREMVGDDLDSPDLFHLSLRCAQNRVTVKRPKDAAEISSSTKISHTIIMKSGRFDVYMKNHL